MRRLPFESDARVLLPDGSTRPLRRYLVPAALLLLGAALLAASAFAPYWTMRLEAPQYPDGLHVEVYLDHLEGDVAEVDELNHYLGLPPLEESGRLERRAALPSLAAMTLLLVAAVFVANRWAAALAVPAVTFPLAFLADLWLILYRFGHSVDPESALGGAVKPFTPPLFGRGVIGQFASVASPGPGLWLAAAASVLVLVGLWLHVAAYKPLARRRREPEPAPERAGVHP